MGQETLGRGNTGAHSGFCLAFDLQTRETKHNFRRTRLFVLFQYGRLLFLTVHLKKTYPLLHQIYERHLCKHLSPNKSKHFQQWMSWLLHRWRTQRNAIRHANCKTSESSKLWTHLALPSGSMSVGVSIYPHHKPTCRLVQAIASFVYNAQDVYSRRNSCGRPILRSRQLVWLGGGERRYDVNLCIYVRVFSLLLCWRVWCACIRLDLQSVKNTRWI